MKFWNWFKREGPTNRAQLRAEQTIQPPNPQDPGGSYTGKPMDGEKPIQDADDL